MEREFRALDLLVKTNREKVHLDASERGHPRRPKEKKEDGREEPDEDYE